jgi:cytochrome c2
MRCLLLLALILICGCEQKTPQFDPSAQTAELVLQREGDAQTIEIPFVKFASMKGIPSLSYQDSLYGEERRYLGLTLAQLQELGQADSEYGVLKFHCRDGFVSEVTTDVLEQGQFMLAFRDVDAAPDTFLRAEKMTYLKEKPAELTARLESSDLSPEEEAVLIEERDHLKTLARDMESLKNQGPFYPIFIPGDDLPKEKRWNPPFAVNKVVFAKTETDRSKARPEGLSADHPAMRGSKHFEERCAVCHAINGIGGSVGPELNRPQSVTEYWEQAALRQLLKDPSKVRENSKMPPLHLKDPMIEEILAYLKWMATEKKILN